MVKKWIIMIVLSLMLIVGCIFESKYVNDSLGWFINSLETLQITIAENEESIDKAEIVRDSYKIHDEWHEKVKVLKGLIWHTGIKEAEIGLARISGYIKENNYTEAYVEIAALIDYAAHYRDDFKISFENLF